MQSSRALSRAALPEKTDYLLGRERPAIKETLHCVTTMGAEEFQLRFRLDPLGVDFQLETVNECMKEIMHCRILRVNSFICTSTC